MPKPKASIISISRPFPTSVVNAKPQNQHHQHQPPPSNTSGFELKPKASIISISCPLLKAAAVNAKAQSQRHQHQPHLSHISGCECQSPKPASAASAAPFNTSGCECHGPKPASSASVATFPHQCNSRTIPIVAAVNAKAQSQHHQHQPPPSNTSGFECQGPNPASAALF